MQNDRITRILLKGRMTGWLPRHTHPVKIMGSQTRLGASKLARDFNIKESVQVIST